MAQKSTLRILARAYSDGKIDKEKYRTDRTSFFEALVEGNAELPAEQVDTDEQKLARGDTFSNITRQKRAQQSIEPQPAKTPEPEGLLQKNPKLIFAGIGGVIIIIVLAVIFSGGEDTPSQPTQSANDNAPSPAMVDAPPSPLQNHISDFLSANTWSEADLDRFRVQWQTFSDIERASTMDTIEFSRLVNAISKKLLEERALAAIGNPETSYEKQRQLVEFSNSIGIRDQRITLPDAP